MKRNRSFVQNALAFVAFAVVATPSGWAEDAAEASLQSRRAELKKMETLWPENVDKVAMILGVPLNDDAQKAFSELKVIREKLKESKTTAGKEREVRVLEQARDERVRELFENYESLLRIQKT